jgi:uncharacterized membrane protein YbhN (UPF0104 family)
VKLTLRRAAAGTLAAGVTAASLWYVLRGADARQLWHGLATLGWGWLLLGVAANFGAMAFQAARLRVFVNECGALTYRQSLVILPVVFTASNLMPLRGGELVKARLLVRMGGMSYARSAGAITADHAFAALGLTVLGVAVWARGFESRWLADLLAAGAAFGLAAAGAAVAIERRRGRRLPVVSRLDDALRAFGESFRVFVKPREGAAALVFTALAWLCEWLVGLAVLQAVGIPATGLRAALMLLGVNAAGLLPLTPGQVGLYELAAAFVLTHTGASPSEAALAALAYHAVHALPTAALAAAVLGADGAARAALFDLRHRAAAP